MPKMDFVFTVCDQAAGEVCPIWPGNPMTAHWSIPDPTAEGTKDQKLSAFRDATNRLDARIKLFVGLPFENLDLMAIKREAEKIGHIDDKPDGAAS
jgi:arsenate reductase